MLHVLSIRTHNDPLCLSKQLSITGVCSNKRSAVFEQTQIKLEGVRLLIHIRKCIWCSDALPRLIIQDNPSCNYEAINHSMWYNIGERQHNSTITVCPLFVRLTRVIFTRTISNLKININFHMYDVAHELSVRCDYCTLSTTRMLTSAFCHKNIFPVVVSDYTQDFVPFWV